jgi:hypothetical protein
MNCDMAFSFLSLPHSPLQRATVSTPLAALRLVVLQWVAARRAARRLLGISKSTPAAASGTGHLRPAPSNLRMITPRTAADAAPRRFRSAVEEYCAGCYGNRRFLPSLLAHSGLTLPLQMTACAGLLAIADALADSPAERSDRIEHRTQKLVTNERALADRACGVTQPSLRQPPSFP